MPHWKQFKLTVPFAIDTPVAKEQPSVSLLEKYSAKNKRGAALIAISKRLDSAHQNPSIGIFLVGGSGVNPLVNT